MRSRSLNNKVLGNAFEAEICEFFAKNGWWVHFIAPAANGGQPFDIIAVKGGTAIAGDCKTSVKPIFPITRLEQNQIFAFERWIAAGNTMPRVFIKYKNRAYSVPYEMLKREGSVEIESQEILY